MERLANESRILHNDIKANQIVASLEQWLKDRAEPLQLDAAMVSQS